MAETQGACQASPIWWLQSPWRFARRDHDQRPRSWSPCSSRRVQRRRATVRQTVEEVLARIAQAGDDKVWISRLPDEALRDIAAALDARRNEIETLPLY